MKTLRKLELIGVILSVIGLGATMLSQIPPTPKPSIRRVALQAATPAPVQLRISWSYPTNELSSDLTFRVYHSTSLTPPVSWELQWSVVGTNQAVVSVVPGVHFFAIRTYSQFWDQESDFSDAVSTPPVPRGGTNLTISR